jgi:hypothetical protein
MSFEKRIRHTNGFLTSPDDYFSVVDAVNYSEILVGNLTITGEMRSLTGNLIVGTLKGGGEDPRVLFESDTEFLGNVTLTNPKLTSNLLSINEDRLEYPSIIQMQRPGGTDAMQIIDDGSSAPLVGNVEGLLNRVALRQEDPPRQSVPFWNDARQRYDHQASGEQDVYGVFQNQDGRRLQVKSTNQHNGLEIQGPENAGFGLSALTMTHASGMKWQFNIPSGAADNDLRVRYVPSGSNDSITHSTFTREGFLGFGTENPQAVVHIDKAHTANVFLRGGNAEIRLQKSDASEAWTLGTRESDPTEDLVLYHGAQERFRVTQEGNVHLTGTLPLDKVRGVLDVAHGGTGSEEFTKNTVLIGNGSGSLYGAEGLTWDGAEFDIQGTLNVNGNTNVYGNLIVTGNTSKITSEELLIKDNIVVLNANTQMESPPPIDLQSGLEIFRGTEEIPYFFLYDESRQWFVLGTEDDLQAVATRADDPGANTIAFWDSTRARFSSNAGVVIAWLATWASGQRAPRTPWMSRAT